MSTLSQHAALRLFQNTRGLRRDGRGLWTDARGGAAASGEPAPLGELFATTKTRAESGTRRRGHTRNTASGAPAAVPTVG
jgi:hypothetical protein